MHGYGAIGVLGLGSIGLRHARNLICLGREVVGFDPSPDRSDMLRRAGGQPAGSRDDVLRRCCAVVIATPSQYHLADLDAAVSSGRPALVEKPLAHDPDAAESILDHAAASNLIVFAGLNLRFHPAVRMAKDILVRGELGTPLWARLIGASFLPDWRPHQDHRTGYAAAIGTGGVLFDLIHEFDLAVHLLGPASTVHAVARNTGTLGIPTEDCADVLLVHAGAGLHSSLHLDYVTRPRRRVTEIAGTGGLLEIDLFARRLKVFEPNGSVRIEEVFPGSFDEDYMDEMKAFLACLDGTASPACDGREALAVLKQVARARKIAELPCQ